MKKINFKGTSYADRIVFIIWALIFFKFSLERKLLFGRIPKKALLINMVIVVCIYFLIELLFKKSKVYNIYFLNCIISIVLLVNIIFYRSDNDVIAVGLIREIAQLNKVQ